MKNPLRSFRVLLLAPLALLSAHAADTVELLPGRITGTIGLSSESVQSGSVYASATDGSSSASASFNGNSYSIVVPAGKSWRLGFYLYPQAPSGGYTYLYVNLPDSVGPVGADETVTKNISLASARITADVQVSNGTLTSVATLQASGSSGGSSSTSFSSYAQGLGYVVALPFSGVSVSGTAAVSSTTNQNSTQTLSSQTVNVSSTGVTATWTLNAAFSAGSIQGSVGLVGAVTPSTSYVYLYGPSGSYVGNQTLQGNGTFQFDNLMAGTHRLYTYAYYASSQLYFSRTAAVVAGNVTQADTNATVALAQIPLNLTGFLTPSRISSASTSGYWTAPNPNPDSLSISASASLNSSGSFTTVIAPGEWRFANVGVNGYDNSQSGVYLYYSLGLYDYQRANQPVTFAAGDNKTLAAFDLNTTQTELTFDVVEPAGATSETLISNASVSGYTTLYANGSPQQQLSFNSSTSTSTPQARQRVRIVGIPGTYSIQTYGTVQGSNVSFGNFNLELRAPLPTPVGTDVAVNAGSGVALVFDQVTTAGVTTASQLPVGPALPGGYTVLTNSGQKVFYGVSTTAVFNGYVDITVDYAADAVPAALEPSLKLFYYDNAAQKWIDVTIAVDAANNKVTGTAPALSLFALGVPHAPVLGAVTVPADGLKGTALTFSATFTDSDPGEAHTAMFTWGDGTTSAGTVNQSAGTISATHTYAQAGTYNGSLALTDITGNTVTRAFTVTVGGVSDTTAPVLTFNAAIVAEATSASGAAVNFTVTARDDTDGAVAVQTSTAAGPVASGATFPLGTTTVTATARDAAGNVATRTFTVTVRDTTAPVIAPLANLTVEATSASGATAIYAASATDNVGATLSYSRASGSVFPLGATTVTVTAVDAAGNTATRTFTVTVRDTTAPAFTSLAPSTASIWPPNHKMVAITVTAATTDAVGPVTTRIVSVTSNEPDNGTGDGDTANDIEITGAMTVNLRAERSGGGNGRIYTITVEATDAAGNATRRTTTVTVPKNQSGK